MVSIPPPVQASAESRVRLRLRYFDEILEVERRAIGDRRKAMKRKPVQIKGKAMEDFPSGPPTDPTDIRLGGPAPPDAARTRPRPRPNNTIGLALSGGGIRSASFCLGALQALNQHQWIDWIDYLSTVSGGGYIGSCLTAALSRGGGFPFGHRNDTRDVGAVGHLRNYSNYLLPRGRSQIRNICDAAVIILRGLVANAVFVLGLLLACAWVTIVAFPTRIDLSSGSFIPRFLDRAIFRWFSYSSWTPVDDLVGPQPFQLTLLATVILALLLLIWALVRSICIILRRRGTIGRMTKLDNDANSPFLKWASYLFGVVIIIAFLDLQPLLINWLAGIYNREQVAAATATHSTLVAIGVLMVGIAIVGDRLGRFLNVSEHSSALRTLVLRIITRIMIYFVATALPLLLLVAYLYICACIEGMGKIHPPFDGISNYYFGGSLILLFISYAFKPNAYSLHQFYRDRLSKAFLFDPLTVDINTATAAELKGLPGVTNADSTNIIHGRPYADKNQLVSRHVVSEATYDKIKDHVVVVNLGDFEPLDDLKLSAMSADKGPYQIINAALNIQGSLDANTRGRNADFFTFTRDFVGSDLTLFASTQDREVNFMPQRPEFAPTEDMERLEPMLDVATAMAISGAAVSANMGSSTVKPLSPTLALLNIRLGYWLRNPWELALPRTPPRIFFDFINVFLTKFYLPLEMLNFLTERSRNIYLSDGGHIENLGIYQLLKRGCQLIIAIDAEADPTMSFPSFVKMERYARIDLGIRFDIQLEEVAEATNRLNWEPETRSHGPHCAVGRIMYPDGNEGVLLYVKSSLTGDDADYVRDYKKRHPRFPHETTGDQFFTEEQFEDYRALGFHAVDGFFNGTDNFAKPRAGRLAEGRDS
jgi:predicted acylesterase/phospholipase RssA